MRTIFNLLVVPLMLVCCCNNISAVESQEYNVLLESDTDSGAGSEVFLASYDSLQDFFDGNLSPSSDYSQLDISPSFSAGGFTYDGLQYHVLLERDADSGAGSEVFLASYDSLQDFFDGNLSSSSDYSQLDISPTFSAGGFDYDGLQYHVLLERDTDSGAGSEVFLASYDSLQDFFDGNLSSSSGYSQLDISPSFSAGGLFSEPNFAVPDLVTTTRGNHVSGGTASLAGSDNVDYVIRRSATDTQSRTEFEALGMSRTTSPSSFEITLEGAVFARTTVVQTIELWNYDMNDWELVDTRNATNLTDSTATLSATGDLRRFVDQVTFIVEARIRFQSTSPRQKFSSNTDQLIWTIGR